MTSWYGYIYVGKVFEAGRNIWTNKGEALEVAKRDFIKALKQLEGALGEKNFFGGDAFGFVDIIGIALSSWFVAYEKFGGDVSRKPVDGSQVGR